MGLCNVKSVARDGNSLFRSLAMLENDESVRCPVTETVIT